MLFQGGTSFLPLLQFCPQEDNLFSFSFLSLFFQFLSFLSSPFLVLFFPLIIFYSFFFSNCWDSAILLAVETVGQGDFGSRWFSIFTHWCICPKREEALLDNMFKWNKLTTALGSKTRSDLCGPNTEQKCRMQGCSHVLAGIWVWKWPTDTWRVGIWSQRSDIPHREGMI